MRFTFNRAVQLEMWQIRDWYDARKDGLGDEFFQEFQSMLDLSGGNPERFPLSSLGRRKVTLRRFPYAIYFRVSLDRIRILVLCHEKRHPDYGKYRK